MKRLMGLSICAALVAASSAYGALVEITMTADNHYAIYADNGGVLTYIGGNELGRDGNPGQFNWSLPEQWSFNATTAIYVAAWSDDSTTRGSLGNVTIDGVDFSTGNSAWRVYDTETGRAEGSPHPTAAEVTGLVNFATANNAFDMPVVVGANGVAPWGVIPGITSGAQWQWAPQGGNEGPNDVPSYVIFCLPVPTPGVLAMAGMGGLLAIRRRR
jgi:hypothetical protein